MKKFVKIFCVISVLFFASGCFKTRPPTITSRSAITLNGALVCTKTKKSQFQSTSRGGRYVPIRVSLRITFHQLGHYRFETWQTRERASDVFGESFEVDIDRVPRQLVFELQKDFYRLQAMRVENNRLETSSCILGSMRNGWPNVLPEDKNY